MNKYTLRASGRVTVLAAGSMCIALVVAPTAQAVVPLEIATPPNAMTFTFVNNDPDITRCSAYAAGPVSFRTPDVRVPARSTTTVSFVDVPAGNYVVDWECRAFDQGKRMVSVGGAALPGAIPREGAAPRPMPSTGSFGSF